MEKLFVDKNTDAILAGKLAGGKAAGLVRIENAGVATSPFIALSYVVMDRFISDAGIKIKVDESEDFEKAEKRIRDDFLKADFTTELKSAILELLSRNNLLGSELAVRSSGLDEDSAEHSFAGQFESFLFQKEEKAILDSIKKCMASAYSERCLSYRKTNGLALGNIKMGIVIQKMIFSEVSGVGFSRNPLAAADRKTMIVDSLYGQGEGIVSGLYDADSYILVREESSLDKIISKKTLVKKEKMLVSSREGGLEEVDVEKDLVEKSSLQPPQLATLKEAIIKLEEKLGYPVDIEFGVEKDKIYILQARPITSLPPDEIFDGKINGSDSIIWDNSNIVESYSGVTSPLTFSFANQAYRQVYIQFCRVMGVPEDLISQNEKTYRNMLGLVRGRVYYNLINWYKLILMLPGSSTNKEFMETMMGVKKELGKEDEGLFDFAKKPPKYSLFSKIKLLWMTVVRFKNIDKITAEFKRDFEKFYSVAIKKDYKSMPITELSDYYSFLNEKMLANWKAPIINDYICMVFFGMVKKMTRKWVPGDAGESLQNDLVAGEGDVLSTEPTTDLIKISELISKGDKKALEEVTSLDAKDLADKYKDRSLNSTVLELMDGYLDKFGFRCVNELKLEEDDLFEDPSFCFSVLKNYLKTGGGSLDTSHDGSHLRVKAEGEVRKHVKGLRLLVFNWVLKHTRAAVKRRENLRFDRTKVFGIARRIFRAIGSNLVSLGKIDHEKDIFFLTVEEITELVEGRSYTEDIRQLISLRKSEYSRYENTLDPPERFMTKGAASLSFAYGDLLSDLDLLKSEIKLSDDPNILYGTPCCPGKVEGEVLVAKTPKDAGALSGQILVAGRTDPGWVPLYPNAKGLLIERGSLLSHSAVVAREMGLPTIVGVSGGLMNKLKTGDRVSFDAAKGEIKIIRD